MAVRVAFLGRLADLAGEAEKELPGPIDWAGLIDVLPQELAEETRSDRVRIAVNGELLADKRTLRVKAGDEVALLPPVSGG